MSQVSVHLDPYQYGCLRGSSTTVYLIRMYHLIVEWLDRGCASVDLFLKDYRKAFDAIRHSVAIINLRTMGTNNVILLLVTNFLQALYQCFYSLFPGDTDSELVELTCRAPQGTKLASLLFLAVINFILSGYEEIFKYVANLSVLLKYIVEQSLRLFPIL